MSYKFTRIPNCRVRGKDKADRATVEQVMDPRTRMILFKLLSRQIVSEINGSISTGKEANVYHATTATGMDRAIKVGTGIFCIGSVCARCTKQWSKFKPHS